MPWKDSDGTCYQSGRNREPEYTEAERRAIERRIDAARLRKIAAGPDRRVCLGRSIAECLAMRRIYHHPELD